MRVGCPAAVLRVGPGCPGAGCWGAGPGLGARPGGLLGKAVLWPHAAPQPGPGPCRPWGLMEAILGRGVWTQGSPAEGGTRAQASTPRPPAPLQGCWRLRPREHPESCPAALGPAARPLGRPAGPAPSPTCHGGEWAPSRSGRSPWPLPAPSEPQLPDYLGVTAARAPRWRWVSGPVCSSCLALYSGSSASPPWGRAVLLTGWAGQLLVPTGWVRAPQV